MSFYIGMGMDKEHIDNIYRCVSKEDATFLEDRLKHDIEEVSKFLKNCPKGDKNEAIKKLNLDWLKKIKLWKINSIEIEGEWENDKN